MSKVSHSAESLDEFAETLKSLVGRVVKLKKDMAALRRETVRFNFEQKRARGVSDISTWLDEAETEIEIAQLRDKKQAAK